MTAQVSVVDHVLSGLEGELVCVSILTEPRELERVLDCLATVSFPVNPELFHGVPTLVEFPAYGDRVAEVRRALQAYGFDPAMVHVEAMYPKLANRRAAGRARRH